MDSCNETLLEVLLPELGWESDARRAVNSLDTRSRHIERELDGLLANGRIPTHIRLGKGRLPLLGGKMTGYSYCGISFRFTELDFATDVVIFEKQCPHQESLVATRAAIERMLDNAEKLIAGFRRELEALR